MTEKLEKYHKKRDFEKTSEPEGKLVKSDTFLKFVVQHHLARRDHFDFRLEWNGILLSWAVPKGPSYNTQDKRLAVQVEDHPLEYRNFEGTIPKGEYGGGTVMLWDEGYWKPQSDVTEGISEGSLKFILEGKRLKGKWALVRLKAKEDDKQKQTNWLLLKENDEFTKIDDGISAFITSIRTGRTMTEIEKGIDKKVDITKNPFTKANVQLAKLVDTAPNGEDWLFELKYDGYRIIAYIQDNNVQLITRNGHDYTKKFQDIADSLITWADGKAMVLDGEMVIIDTKGKTDFQALQNFMRKPNDQHLTYIIFDLLALDGADLREHRLIERKDILENLMKNSPRNLYYSRHIKGNGKESFNASCQANLEGIVGKKENSVYSGTRNGDWIKCKCDNRQEFIIGGYSLTDKKISGISSLLLGVYDGDDLVYSGRAGTGLTEKEMNDLEKQFDKIKITFNPFKKDNRTLKAKANEKIIWLDPVMVAEIKFAEWTKDHLLRQASFKGLRTDKAPREVKREKADEGTEIKANKEQILTKGSDKKMKTAENISGIKTEKKNSKAASDNKIIDGIKITNPDKVIFDDPKITKLDVIRYYEQVAERMLPYIDHRILSIVRCPKGIMGACFFKKHPDKNAKGIVNIPVLSNSGEKEEYFYIENAMGLIFEAQMGTLEFHTWGSREENLEKPDIMVFDLDPDEGMDLKQVRQGVKDLKSILNELSLISYLKTSGGKGYHVVVPFKPSVDWKVFHDFARRIAEAMEQKWPERYTSNVRKDSRKNKIFIDWIRNGRGATSIAPYSIRARKGAKVSMPITWKELDTIAPDGINMGEALKRINGKDPWKDFFSSNNSFIQNLKQ